ncbi:MAG: hypothetical protein WD470_10580 [Rhodospirillaceae bacterium]
MTLLRRAVSMAAKRSASAPLLQARSRQPVDALCDAAAEPASADDPQVLVRAAEAPPK